MKIPTKKELQAAHATATRHNKALILAIEGLAVIAAAPSAVVHPTYSNGALKALTQITKIVKPRK